MSETAESAAEGEDPVLYEFLAFLARDIQCHPERIEPVDAALADRLRSQTHGVSVDLDRPLSPEDE